MASSTSARPEAGGSVDALVVGACPGGSSTHALVNAARAAGAELWERAAVEELLYDGGAVAGVVVRDSDGRRHAIRARLTVGADGLRSVVARRIGRRRHGRLRRLAFVAHVAG